MALNIKLAMLLSLGFIGVMCWLVNQVARPNSEVSGAGTLMIYAAGNDAAPPRTVDLDRPIGAQLASRFEQPTPARPEQAADPGAAAVRGGVEADGGVLAPRLGAASEIDPQRASQTAVAPDPTGRRPPTLPASEGGQPDRSVGDSLGPGSTQYAGNDRPVKPDPDVNVPARPRDGLAQGADASGPTGRAQPESGDAKPVAAAPPSRPTGTTGTYKAQRNDNLYKIARRHWGRATLQDVRLIMDANPAVKKRDGKVLLGEVLVIPDRNAALADASEPAAGSKRPALPREKTGSAGGGALVRGDSKSKRAGSNDAALEAPRASKSAAAGRNAKRRVGADVAGSAEASRAAKVRERAAASRSYRVRAGDSLAKIAERELKDSSRWREIYELNRLSNADHLLAGSTLKLPAPPSDG